jgi:hypothetical protein
LYDGKDQVTPVEPYHTKSGRVPTGDKQGVDQKAAARTLRDNSRCRFGSQIAFDTAPPSTPPTASAGLVMHNQQLFQTGGMARVQDVWVSYTAPKCIGTAQECASANVQLAELHYDLTASAAGGYRQCNGTSTALCDYKVVSTSRSGGSVQGDTHVKVIFYNPTMDAQKIKFAISNVVAKYRYQQRLGDIKLEIENPITGEKVIVTKPGGTRWVTKSFTPSVAGTPVPLSKSGSSWSYNAPVISAVNTPVD